MTQNTRTIIECALAQDLTMTDAEVAAVKRALDWREGGDMPLDAPLDAPLLFVTYAEAARRLGVTVNGVKRMVEEGRLKRVYRGCTKRARGVTPESLSACLRG